MIKRTYFYSASVFNGDMEIKRYHGWRTIVSCLKPEAKELITLIESWIKDDVDREYTSIIINSLSRVS